MGGPSSEHEVSLASGKMVMKQLNSRKYAAAPIKVAKDGHWPVKLADLKNNFDIVFIAMHGEYGEDGQLQSLLEKEKILYTGSNSLVSRLAMDKEKTCRRLLKKNIKCPPFVVFKKGRLAKSCLPLVKLGLPVVVKPNNLGSSVGMSSVTNISQLLPAINKALAHSPEVMIQRFISGRELTCGVLEINGQPIALPPTEIIPKGQKLFDYRAKYTPGASQEITPARLPEKTIKQAQQITLKAYKAIGCSSYARVDMILGNDQQIYFLEINTLPGLTSTSLVPQAARAAGFNFPRLLDIIIENSLAGRQK